MLHLRSTLDLSKYNRIKKIKTKLSIKTINLKLLSISSKSIISSLLLAHDNVFDNDKNYPIDEPFLKTDTRKCIVAIN